MNAVREIVLKSLTALGLCAGLVLSLAMPAGAVTWYTWDGKCGTFYVKSCDVQYTGNYPTGVVRAIGSASDYQIRLQAKSGPTASWVTAATATYSATTTTVKASKSGYYRSCYRTLPQNGFICGAGVYLGD